MSSEKDPKKPDIPWDTLTELLGKAGMTCTNRETAAEKAAAHAWTDKESARRPTRARARYLQAVGEMLEKLRQEHKQAAAGRRSPKDA